MANDHIADDRKKVRLIDANELKGIIQKVIEESDFQLFKDVMRKVCDILDESPTVDAVEVVRCKDCKNRCDEGSCPMYYVEEIEWDDDGYTEVDFVPHDLTHDEGFCDRGERRTEDDNHRTE